MDKKIALVTGGSRGIGAAICKRLAADGYFVIVASRSRDKVDAVAAAIAEQYSGISKTPAGLALASESIRLGGWSGGRDTHSRQRSCGCPRR